MKEIDKIISLHTSASVEFENYLFSNMLNFLNSKISYFIRLKQLKNKKLIDEHLIELYEMFEFFITALRDQFNYYNNNEKIKLEYIDDETGPARKNILISITYPSDIVVFRGGNKVLSRLGYISLENNILKLENYLELHNHQFELEGISHILQKKEINQMETTNLQYHEKSNLDVVIAEILKYKQTNLIIADENSSEKQKWNKIHKLLNDTNYGLPEHYIYMHYPNRTAPKLTVVAFIENEKVNIGFVVWNERDEVNNNIALRTAILRAKKWVSRDLNKIKKNKSMPSILLKSNKYSSFLAKFIYKCQNNTKNINYFIPQWAVEYASMFLYKKDVPVNINPTYLEVK